MDVVIVVGLVRDNEGVDQGREGKQEGEDGEDGPEGVEWDCEVRELNARLNQLFD